MTTKAKIHDVENLISLIQVAVKIIKEKVKQTAIDDLNLNLIEQQLNEVINNFIPGGK